MMSLPKASWTSTVDSGVNRCASPFRCERNRTPSSVTLRRSLRLNTWKPPESVRMARGQDMNRCRPPSERISFVAGPEKKVIRICEQDPEVEVVQEVPLRQALDCGLRADGHEDRGFDVAVGRVKNARAGMRTGALGDDLEGETGQPPILADGRRPLRVVGATPCGPGQASLPAANRPPGSPAEQAPLTRPGAAAVAW